MTRVLRLGRWRRAGLVGALLVVGGSAAPLTAAPPCAEDGWALAVPNQSGVPATAPAPSPKVLGGISGLARLGPRTFLAVHDPKAFDDEPAMPAPAVRAHRLVVEADGRVARERLTWAPLAGGKPPIDLEAVALLPGTKDEALAVESGGGWYHVRVGSTSVDVLAAGTLANPPPQIEGFALRAQDGRVLAVWAGRGAGTTAADVRWGVVERGTDGKVTSIVAAAGHAQVRAPGVDGSAPTTRHVSDLAVSACGEVWATAAQDPGDDGPYRSVVHAAGFLEWRDGGARFRPFPCARAWFPSRHKAEGLVLTPRGVVLASDDENCGGWLLATGGG